MVNVHAKVRATATQLTRQLGDIVIAGALLLGTMPLLLMVALAIRCESPGPILERQPCMTRGGRRISLLGFRTTAHAVSGGARWGDQPSTQVGHFLRYTRIDRLPELINILRGEINLLESDRYSPSFLE
jgi:lipopolysaccharide/colanic/teichoic acid biosynthesis glycosyltransferase